MPINIEFCNKFCYFKRGDKPLTWTLWAGGSRQDHTLLAVDDLNLPDFITWMISRYNISNKNIVITGSSQFNRGYNISLVFCNEEDEAFFMMGVAHDE